MKSARLIVRSATGDLFKGNTTTGGGPNRSSDLGRSMDGRDHACVGHGDHPCVDKTWLLGAAHCLSIVRKTSPELVKHCPRSDQLCADVVGVRPRDGVCAGS